MVNLENVIFEDLSCVQISNDLITAWITRDLGPRVLGLSWRGSENLFVVLPDAKIPVSGQDDYSLRGGHRLWYAPEIPLTTYQPDDRPIKITENKQGITALQPVDERTGIQKSFEVIMSANQAQITLDHKLTNLGEQSFRLAPWAITMLRPGGTGLIPLQSEPADEHGLWPNREIVFWPYTNISSRFLNMNDGAISITADLKDGAIKVGASNPQGWLAYGLDGTLFVKKAIYQEGEEYLDRGASSQIYCNQALIELETLGPVIDLQPGQSTSHQETWQIFREGDWPDEIRDHFELI